MNRQTFVSRTTYPKATITRLRTACGSLFLLALPIVVQGQFDYVTNGSSIAITEYTGPGGAVIIPSTTNGLPVSSIENYAFSSVSNLNNVVIPQSVTYIGVGAFLNCTSLTNIAIPDSVIY